MAQDLTLNIKTTSDVPQAMDRAKAATTSFNGQVEAIGKKFGSSFKDIFLSFLGPMALVGAAFSFIGQMIEENQKKQAEANQAAIDGTNSLMSAEDKYWANKKNNEKKTEEAVEQAKTQRIKVTEEFINLNAFSDPRMKKIMDREGLVKSSVLAQDPKIQEEVQAMIAEDMAKNPDAGANAAAEEKAQTAAQKASDDAAKAKGTTFKGPEGFSNVVGVGANPVMEAMTMQLEETRKQTALLEILANPGGAGVPVDFTKVEAPTMTT